MSQRRARLVLLLPLLGPLAIGPEGMLMVRRAEIKGATLAFEGQRATYTCGMKDGDTVALLGDLAAAEGGFRILRARIADGESGFTLRSSEPILVTASR